MQYRRFIGAIISVILIVTIVLVFKDPWSTFHNNGKQVALSNPAAIDRIILSDRGDSVLLIKKGEEWLLFGEEMVNPVTVENLLFAGERLQINSIVAVVPGAPVTLYKSITFLKGEKVVRAYRFAAHGDHYEVSSSRSDQNFLVSIAGYPDLNLDRVFSSSVDHYREHLLIDLLPSEISYVQVELANGHAFRFTQRENGDITCSPANAKTTLPSGSPDNLSTRLLFSYFTPIRYEKRAGITVDEFTDTEGFNGRIATLQVGSYKGEEYSLQVYPYHFAPGEEAHLFQALVLYNNGPDMLVVNYIYLDVLMRDLSHYFGGK